MHDIGLILTITVGLTVALILGIITQRVGLSPIVGYLLAGLVVGPHTPGFVADKAIATQLAEIGVILLMFGVGLHFHLKDLMAVKNIAIPGAIGQSLVATVLGAVVAVAFGWSVGVGVVLGIAMSVASTVVLLRVLMDAGVLNTKQGHIAVGWLVVEDLFTVLVLVMLPAVVGAMSGDGGGVVAALGMALLKLGGLAALVLVAGAKAIPWLLSLVARTRSKELFTLTVLVLALGIATGSAVLFGASMALGAFLAGMVVGQSDVSHQAAADALPMRDAFAVLFFVSVGMLFDPMFLIQRPWLVLAALGVILIGKPLAALLIVLAFGHPIRTALTVSIALAQIGEFSFILAQLGEELKILPSEGYSVLVAGALISITINPLLFGRITAIENFLRRRPTLWRLLNWRLNKALDVAAQGAPEHPAADPATLRAVVVGFGPVGRTLVRILNDFNIRPMVVDMNVDTIKKLTASGIPAIYGDAGQREILEAAGIAEAKFLFVTLPDLAGRIPVVATARMINPGVKVFVRARYIGERAMLEESGATAIAYEEAEVAVVLAEFLLREIGADDEAVEREMTRVRSEISVRTELTMVK